MTTTSNADPNTETIAATLYDDRDTYTLAEAWVSSPLGELDAQSRDDFAATEAVEQPRRSLSRGPLFALLASGIIGGATLGAVLFGSPDPSQPTFVVPWSAVKTSPAQTVLPPPANMSATPKPAASAPKPVHRALAPKPVVPEQKTNPEAVRAPDAAADPAPPPVNAPPVVVHVYIPPWLPLHHKPEPPAPQAPDPQPPKSQPPTNIDVVNPINALG